MSDKKMPQVPYGAVYFRKSNPPRGDWERDYARASGDGMNIFRHWFMWGSIETAPGVYDWEDYDKQLELGARYGIKTIAAEMITSVPEWVYSKYGHILQVKADGTRVKSHMGGSSSTGGYGGVCLDHPEARELAGRFLKELVLRYKDHESMLGYDIWNECNYSNEICYCEMTQEKFREWLRKKYGELKNLNKTWLRYSYSEWEDVCAPDQMGPYPECMDWLEFKKENFYDQMQWRIDLIRSLDGINLITAHGIAAGLTNMFDRGTDDWTAASKVEIYGFTWVASRKGSEPWKQWHAVDLVRAGSRSKPFWHAETQQGPLWLQPQVIGRPIEDGRITAPEDIRIWNMISFAGGARGILCPRWRPLLNGPLFGAFGAYGMDGMETARSNMAGTIAKWANDKAQEDLFKASPVKGEIGIVVVPEAQMFETLLSQKGTSELYAQAMWGAYRGFFDNNIQADWVLIDHIDEYDLLYLPYPVMLSGKSADKLLKWVEGGGMLISEGCPGYFGDMGWVGVVQPNGGSDKVFGAVQEDVEFMPDIGENIAFLYEDMRVRGGLYLQSYIPVEAKARGWYTDNRTAVVENAYGAGRTLLIGTFPSEGYYRTADPVNRKFFSEILRWSGKKQQIKVSDGNIKARMHRGKESRYLWILNCASAPVQAQIDIGTEVGNISVEKVFWGSFDGRAKGNTLHVKLPGKDALIVKIG